MKTKIIILSILLIGFLSPSFSQEFQRSKKITKSFKVYPETQIEIFNKYGNVDIIPWEKDCVKIEIDLTVSAKREVKMEKVWNEIDFEFKNTKHYCIIKTIPRKGENTISGELNKLKDVIQGDGTAQIHYVVHMPANNKLRLENRFGDIYVGNLMNDVEIDLAYGNLKAYDFVSNTNIKIRFGDGAIHSIKNGWVSISYGDLRIDNAISLFLIAKSARVDIDYVDELKIASKRSKNYFGEISSIGGTGDFSDINIALLHEKAVLTAKYGKTDIKKCAPGVKNIELALKFNDFSIDLANANTYNLHITDSKSRLFLPTNISNYSKDTIGEKNPKHLIRGNIGTSGSPCNVAIISSFSEIRITNR